MKAIILIPHERATFHLGETGLDDTSDLLHSDTLFSALANVNEIVFDNTSGFIQQVASGRLRFSSGFPALCHGGRILMFLPRPLIGYSATERSKKAKAVRFLSLGLWKKLCDSFDPDTVSCNLDLLAYPLIGGGAFLPDELPGLPPVATLPPVWRMTDIPKVKVHTIESSNRLYHETVLQSTPIDLGNGKIQGCFAVLVKHSLAQHEWDDFLATFRILADEGIGGQRSTGRGQFDSIAVIDIDLPDIGKTAHHLGLSLLSPNGNREFHEGLLAYDLLRRGGGTLGRQGSGDAHRRQAKMAREGALLAWDLTGQLVDVSPAADGSIFRNGMNFSIPIGVMQ